MCPNTSGLIGTCDEKCSSDDGCSNGQLCCSNGCGHDCMDPVMDCSVSNTISKMNKHKFYGYLILNRVAPQRNTAGT